MPGTGAAAARSSPPRMDAYPDPGGRLSGRRSARRCGRKRDDYGDRRDRLGYRAHRCEGGKGRRCRQAGGGGLVREVARPTAGALFDRPVTVMVRERDDARRREADDDEDGEQGATELRIRHQSLLIFHSRFRSQEVKARRPDEPKAPPFPSSGPKLPPPRTPAALPTKRPGR
jgi:hypothetical protein